MKRIILTIGAALAIAGAMAQTSFDRDMGGLLMDRDVMTPA